MRLRFNEGAIVELTLLGNRRTSKITGKVEKVYPDEVEIRLQRRIIRERPVKPYKNMQEILLNEFSTCNTTEVVHVNRQLIKSWRYARIDEITDVFKPIGIGSWIERWQDLNVFDQYGICKGKGKPCCGIVEKYDQPISIICRDVNK